MIAKNKMDDETQTVDFSLELLVPSATIHWQLTPGCGFTNQPLIEIGRR